jgi:hypothetical protein
VHYTAPPPGESLCIRGEDIVSEKVGIMSIRVLPSDTSESTGLVPSSDETGHAGINPAPLERPAEHLGAAEFLGEQDDDGIPLRRRATFGELCQLLVLFMVLGLLHYVSAQWAARWYAPPPAEIERTAPRCE